MRWFLVSFAILFVVQSIVFHGFLAGIARTRGESAALTIGVPLSLLVLVGSFTAGWFLVGKPQLLKQMAEGVARHRARAKSLGERIVIATVSTLVVTLVMLALGLSTEVKMLVIPLGFIAIFIGASVLG